MKTRYKEYGVSSMLHGNCGRQPKRTFDIAKSGMYSHGDVIKVNLGFKALRIHCKSYL